MCGFRAERGDIYEEKKLNLKNNLPKISFQQNFEFSKSVERFKSYNFVPSMYKKKVQE